ncbi:hypothetical protein GCM10023211_01990 [Orbus sasakiae]|uniref:Uncharacterized protein n=1 Tax=Orbus sasakiae TaxID=1078475 RepID=A0ABP9N0J7_9GAMM
MSVSTDITLIRMIEYKQIFFGLIDHLDKQEQGGEIPLALYYKLVTDVINNQVEPKSRQLKETFDPDNLFKTGLLLELDKSRNILVFQGFVLDMFRHFDKSRLRELSSEQLESLRQDLNDSYERLNSISLSPGDEIYEEVVALLFERLRHTHGRIKQNITSLQGQTERLSAIAEAKNIQDLTQTRLIREALIQINRIYQRHVLPTLQFLNEREDLKRGKPALTAVGEIAQLFEQSGFPEISQRIQFAQGSIRSYSKNIEIIRKTLERYVRQGKRQRHQYDCIEHLFNQLKAESQLTQDGKLNNKYVNKDSKAFHFAYQFTGLKTHRFAPRLDWRDNHQSVLFTEYLRVTLPKLREKLQNQLVHLDNQNNLNQNEQQHIRHKMNIQKLMAEYVLPKQSDDLHLLVHNYLYLTLSDYKLVDLLDGLGWLRSRIGLPIKVQFLLKEIIYGGLKLVYHPLQLNDIQDTSDD